ncbi:MAG: hypothetical protein U1C49_00335, partial [Candidatus Andersenbacteria bacterium]|nr:hypothetical protein [Candidatus Andersenbacteria bacterium]
NNRPPAGCFCVYQPLLTLQNTAPQKKLLRYSDKTIVYSLLVHHHAASTLTGLAGLFGLVPTVVLPQQNNGGAKRPDFLGGRRWGGRE